MKPITQAILTGLSERHGRSNGLKLSCSFTLWMLSSRKANDRCTKSTGNNPFTLFFSLQPYIGYLFPSAGVNVHLTAERCALNRRTERNELERSAAFRSVAIPAEAELQTEFGTLIWRHGMPISTFLQTMLQAIC